MSRDLYQCRDRECANGIIARLFFNVCAVDMPEAVRRESKECACIHGVQHEHTPGCDETGECGGVCDLTDRDPDSVALRDIEEVGNEMD